MPKLRSVSLVAVTSLSLLLSACQKKAEGQVVAIVNGEEITLTELNAEIAEMNLPASADKNAVRSRVLQRMVDRRLLVQAAKEAGLDRDPAYLTQERRMQEQLLVSMYGKKAMDTIKVPDTAALDRFVSTHPQQFAERTRFRLDQLVIDMPSDPKRLKELESAHTLDEVASRLTAMGISFQRNAGALDSATVAPQVLQRILALPAGEPFIVPNGNRLVINSIVGREPISVTPEQSRQMAAQAMRNEELNKIGEQRLQEAKTKAKIEYQPGFEPKDDAGKSTPAIGAATNGAAPATP
ncbi:EpsD family peptidyl-prolyl cis-trans isomerase [Sphingobium lignivorans]|uniref:EpsD family peptidyl-prolyl cis-trans isomerase n=1 Tax=Sphingobium lignivorans TaxID=2735886 RepID=A0ABR6NBK0_9SPHN|nr:EpsD family peptidyl-prolyl cis-trans isomerase [Sphingobium lignivorans]MBB5984664.1 EpsD family peptidyl-prolyl cis-trans isomerase [Sphingobium lignivorans]